MLKKFFIVVIVVLLLQVVKIALIKLNYRYANFSGILIMAIQFYIVLFPPVQFLIRKLLVFIKSNKTKLIVSSLAAFFVFVLLELLMGFYLNNPKSIPGFLQNPIWLFYEKYDFQIIQYKKDQGVYDDKLFYRLKPNSKFVFANREFADSFWVNSKGLRDDELSLQSPEVICLGDSYFMGWGIKQDSTFANLLEAKSGLRVLNAAISSYGTAREFEMLQQLDTSNLKYLVIQYCVNDWEENKYYLKHNRKLKISSADQFSAEQYEHYLSRLYFPGRYSSMLGHLCMKFTINKFYKVFNLPFDRFAVVKNEQEQAKDFLEMLLLNKDTYGNAKLLITLMDSHKRIDNKFLAEFIEQLKQPKYASIANRITVIRTEKLFDKDDFYWLDQHAKASANLKLAKLVSDSLSAGQEFDRTK